MNMVQQTFELRFHTPAFLGNAQQSGQWRTPPFKAQLRQWWRMAYMAHRRFPDDVTQMREAEALLFGHAWLESDRDANGRPVAARKSQVRIRLGQWDIGKLKGWDGLEQRKVPHPEAEKAGRMVGPHAYLGYGPLDGRGGTKFSEKVNAAIQAGEHTRFSLVCPQGDAGLIQQALRLMDRFGTVGGRSRNGWGSYTLQGGEGQATTGFDWPMRDWQLCLQLDWPHALGQDDRGALIWQTSPYPDWKQLMRGMAMIKIGMRTQFPFSSASHPEPEPRHWLSYPVTRHPVRGWGGNARLPNSLRFKARPLADGRLAGVIFHVPCRPPWSGRGDLTILTRVWQQVHAYLDDPRQGLTRMKASDHE